MNSIQNHILTAKEYQETLFAQSGEDLYSYKLEKGNKALYYFGTKHISDPTHSMFEKLKNTFVNFKPDVVYVEGNPAINDDKEKYFERLRLLSETEAKAHGESRFTLKLAADLEIDALSPEPDLKDIIIYLQEHGLEPKDIFSYYLYLMLNQYNRKNKGNSFNMKDYKNYTKPQIDEFRSYSGWSENIIESLLDGFFKEFNDKHIQTYINQLNPIPQVGEINTHVNEVARLSSYFRDIYMVEQIEKGLHTHNRLFIVFGAAHAVKQEQSLKLLFNDLEKQS